MVRALKKCLQILNMDVWGTPHDTSLNFLLVFEYSNTYNFKAEILPFGQNKKLEKVGKNNRNGKIKGFTDFNKYIIAYCFL